MTFVPTLIRVLQGWGATRRRYDSLIRQTPGLVAYYRLGEAAGAVAYDEHRGDNPGGTGDGVYNGPALGTVGISGGDGNTGITLDGVNDAMTVTSRAALNITGDITVEAWAKPSAVITAYRSLLCKGTSFDISARQYLLGVTSANVWWGALYVGTSQLQVASTITPSLTAWTHLALTRSGTAMNLYVNGVLAAGPVTVTGSLNALTGLFAVGQLGDRATEFWLGSVDEVALYNVALPVATLLEHYTVGSYVAPAAPVGVIGPPVIAQAA